ncbi:MAG: SDR family oxidoreductase [Dehalococcoidia bacterium]|nr:MAG: SDR family oxidoreductase [Dehalococcoidia bacterium]
MELEDKIALVTGAGQGMGKAIALAFAREGADVVANDVNLDTAETTASEVRELGRRSMAMRADVSSQDEVNRMVERVIREWGGVDILVNNAGIGNARMVEDMTDEEWHHVLGVNLDGTFYCSKAVIETMKSRGGGKIINISSLAGKKMSIAGCAAYTASKAGILGFTRHFAFEVGPYKINVNAICPGATLTPKLQESPEKIKSLMNGMPLKDICRPEDIADTALFLASNKSRMLTGTTIDVDAGESVVNQDWEGYVKRRKEALAKGESAH